MYMESGEKIEKCSPQNFIEAVHFGYDVSPSVIDFGCDVSPSVIDNHKIVPILIP